MIRKIRADERLRKKYAAQEKARIDAISSMAFVEARGIEKGKADTLIKLYTKKIGKLPSKLQEIYETLLFRHWIFWQKIYLL